MKLRDVNYILLFLGIVLVVNLFYPLSFSGNVVAENLGCEVNGNYVSDVNLCCSEMSKFLSCEDGVCVNGDYVISVEEDALDYCKERGYNVRY